MVTQVREEKNRRIKGKKRINRKQLHEVMLSLKMNSQKTNEMPSFSKNTSLGVSPVE